MRVECESCRELVVASFAIDGAAVRVTCPACHHVMSVPEGGDGVGDGVGDVVADTPGDVPLCPKCGARYRREATACPTCGLRVARMAAYADAAAMETVPEVVPRAVEEAWQRATEDWNDATRHEELLKQVAASDSYAWAAARYRQRGPDATSARQLARLRRAAEATFLVGLASAPARPDPTAKPYRATRRVLALLITTIAAGALYAMVIRDHPLPSATGSIPAGRLTPGHPVSPSTSK